MKRFKGSVFNMPPRYCEALGSCLGRLAFWLDIRHRRIVEQNLGFVFPHLAPRQLRSLSRDVFKHFGIMVLETLQIPCLSRSQLLERVRIENQHILSEAMSHPRGCLIYSAHLGNWEIGLLGLAAHTERSILTVAKPIKLKMAHRWLTTLRSGFGNAVVFKKGAMPIMRKTLRKGGVVGILIDQGVRRTEAVEVRFLGRRTMATPAAALLVLRGRMPAVPMACIREAQGRYIIKVLPPVSFDHTRDLRQDIQLLTQILIHSLEPIIRAYPEQWFWFHKRWKRTHPGLYPEYQVLRRRRRQKKGLPP